MASLTAQSSFLLARQTTGQRLLHVSLALVVLLGLAIMAGVAAGAAPIPVARIPQILLHPLGVPLDPAIPDSQVTIVHQVRLPRVLTAMLVGAALATGGAVMQGIFRNPLADPGILGVSAGGATGAVFAFSTGLSLAGVWVVPAFAFAGALLAATAVYLLSLERGRAHVTTLLLAGTALNAFLGAVTSTLLLATDEVVQAQVILNWLVGGLAGRGWRHVLVLVLPTLACIGLVFGYSRDLNLFLLGEETAQGLGTNVPRTRFLLLALVALMTGISVSVAGPIGFAGLVVPHLLRLIVGPDHRVLLPASALGGGAFLIAADTVARLLITFQEVPVGVITGLLGGPFFLFLLWRYRRNARLL
ncbi:MAG: iron ABC transporter permease [Chloroflexota bacterium]